MIRRIISTILIFAFTTTNVPCSVERDSPSRLSLNAGRSGQSLLAPPNSTDPDDFPLIAGWLKTEFGIRYSSYGISPEIIDRHPNHRELTLKLARPESFGVDVINEAFTNDPLGLAEALAIISYNRELFDRLSKPGSLGIDALREIFRKEPRGFICALNIIANHQELFDKLSSPDSISIDALRVVFRKKPSDFIGVIRTIIDLGADTFIRISAIAKPDTFPNGLALVRKFIKEAKEERSYTKRVVALAMASLAISLSRSCDKDGAYAKLSRSAQGAAMLKYLLRLIDEGQTPTYYDLDEIAKGYLLLEQAFKAQPTVGGKIHLNINPISGEARATSEFAAALGISPFNHSWADKDEQCIELRLSPASSAYILTDTIQSFLKLGIFQDLGIIDVETAAEPDKEAPQQLKYINLQPSLRVEGAFWDEGGELRQGPKLLALLLLAASGYKREYRETLPGNIDTHGPIVEGGGVLYNEKGEKIDNVEEKTRADLWGVAMLTQRDIENPGSGFSVEYRRYHLIGTAFLALYTPEGMRTSEQNKLAEIAEEFIEEASALCINAELYEAFTISWKQGKWNSLRKLLQRLESTKENPVKDLRNRANSILRAAESKVTGTLLSGCIDTISQDASLSPAERTNRLSQVAVSLGLSEDAIDEILERLFGDGERGDSLPDKEESWLEFPELGSEDTGQAEEGLGDIVNEARLMAEKGDSFGFQEQEERAAELIARYRKKGNELNLSDPYFDAWIQLLLTFPRPVSFGDENMPGVDVGSPADYVKGKLEGIAINGKGPRAEVKKKVTDALVKHTSEPDNDSLRRMEMGCSMVAEPLKALSTLKRIQSNMGDTEVKFEVFNPSTNCHRVVISRGGELESKDKFNFCADAEGHSHGYAVPLEPSPEDTRAAKDLAEDGVISFILVFGRGMGDDVELAIYSPERHDWIIERNNQKWIIEKLREIGLLAPRPSAPESKRIQDRANTRNSTLAPQSRFAKAAGAEVSEEVLFEEQIAIDRAYFIMRRTTQILQAIYWNFDFVADRWPELHRVFNGQFQKAQEAFLRYKRLSQSFEGDVQDVVRGFDKNIDNRFQLHGRTIIGWQILHDLMMHLRLKGPRYREAFTAVRSSRDNFLIVYSIFLRDFHKAVLEILDQGEEKLKAPEFDDYDYVKNIRDKLKELKNTQTLAKLSTAELLRWAIQQKMPEEPPELTGSGLVTLLPTMRGEMLAPVGDNGALVMLPSVRWQKVGRIRLAIVDDVPDPDDSASFFLTKQLKKNVKSGEHVLIVDSRSGFRAIVSAKKGAWIDAVDSVASAVFATRLNAIVNKQEGRIKAWQADSLEGLGAYDVIAFKDSRDEPKLSRSFLLNVAAHLNPNGRVYYTNFDDDDVRALFREAGLEAKVLQPAKGTSPQAVFELRPIANPPAAKLSTLAEQAQILRQSP